jgi:flagellar protein FliL
MEIIGFFKGASKMSAGKSKDHQDEHEEGEEKPKSKKKLIIIIVLVLLLGGGGAGAYFTGMLDSFIGGGEKSDKKGEKEEAHGEDKADEAHGDTGHGEKDSHGSGKDGAPKITYHDLPEFVANLNPGSATPSFIKMAVTIEAATPEIITKIQEKQPKIQDIINTYLRELRPSDLKGSAGVHRLREELTLRINKTLYPDKINNILFKELLIQ